MKIAVLYNPTQVQKDVIDFILKRIGDCGHAAELFSSADEINGDRLLVLGGDGTVLRAAKAAAQKEMPIVAVNYGTLGFLTEFNREETDQAVDFILSEAHSVLNRSMIDVVWNNRHWHCLNEVVLSRKVAVETSDKVIRFHVAIDRNAAGDYAADGMIVATPTGSIAYSLSAGGSILTPDCENFILTPICAFSLKSRPIVCSDNSEISFVVAENGAEVALHGDGEFLGTAQGGDVVYVRKSKMKARFLLRKQGEFFHRLINKING